MNQETDTFPSVSSNPSTSSSSIDKDFDLSFMISPNVLFYITFLSFAIFFFALLHLLVRFLLRPQTGLDDAYADSNDFQGRIQTRLNIHDSGVGQSLINAFPLFHYMTMIGLKHKPLDCAVCLSEFKAEDELRLLPKCSHAFHVECIDTWILTNSTCPLCRDNLLHSLTASSSPIVLVHEFDGESSRDSYSQHPLTDVDDIESKLVDVSGDNDESPNQRMVKDLFSIV
ncbi:hypothetical protein CARUB_v10028015mg [Capsella rubella]|uniref:RING-type E3 ubiquitin transferase n=1 Tax=Capsella rubella TaxID=81985 RepID=R0GQT8_9BRAS|nr:putative RING-H2 finger protein ATL50 [Capsella rubella]EOA14725.1 hypothetical protein CARUB_v10028015mg [Capsella rubella]